MNTKAKGEISEAKVLCVLLEAGLTVLLPWGENKPYDIAVDLEGKLIRIQCKTGKLSGETITFNTSSVYYDKELKRPAQKSYKAGSVDVFAIYCFALGKVYFITAKDCSSCKGTLRTVYTRFSQNAKLADDYDCTKKNVVELLTGRQFVVE